MMRQKGRITVTAWIIGGLATLELTPTLTIEPRFYFRMAVEQWATPSGESLDLPPRTILVRAEKPIFQVTLAKLALGDRFTLTGDVRELLLDKHEARLLRASDRITAARLKVLTSFDRWTEIYSHRGPDGSEAPWLREKRGYLRGVINEFVAGTISLYEARPRVATILAPYPRYAQNAAARLFDHQQTSYDWALAHATHHLQHHFVLEHLHYVTRNYMAPSKSHRLDRVDHEKMQLPVYWKQVVRQLEAEADRRQVHGQPRLPLSNLMRAHGNVKWTPDVPEE